MAENKTCLREDDIEELLARMAKSVGLRLSKVPETARCAAHWRFVRERAGQEQSITLSWFSPQRLLDVLLTHETAFIDCGAVMRNPFCGMTLDELRVHLDLLDV